MTGLTMKNIFGEKKKLESSFSGVRSAVKEIMSIRQKISNQEKEFDAKKKEINNVFNSGSRRTKGLPR